MWSWCPLSLVPITIFIQQFFQPQAICLWRVSTPPISSLSQPHLGNHRPGLTFAEVADAPTTTKRGLGDLRWTWIPSDGPPKLQTTHRMVSISPDFWIVFTRFSRKRFSEQAFVGRFDKAFCNGLEYFIERKRREVRGGCSLHSNVNLWKIWLSFWMSCRASMLGHGSHGVRAPISSVPLFSGRTPRSKVSVILLKERLNLGNSHGFSWFQTTPLAEIGSVAKLNKRG